MDPHLLTEEQYECQSATRIMTCHTSILTGDETWIYFYQQASKKVGLEDNELRLIELRLTSRSSFRSKIPMFMIFINCREVVCFDILSEHGSMTGGYHCEAVLAEVVSSIVQ